MNNHTPKNVFLDTNVLLDDILSREGTESAKKILQLGIEKVLRICMSAITTVNIAYITRKAISRERLYEVFGMYLDYFVILPDSDMDVYSGIRSDNPDFEDAMQLCCADSGRVDAIITNNKKHFAPYTDIPVYTPDEFLAKIVVE